MAEKLPQNLPTGGEAVCFTMKYNGREIVLHAASCRVVTTQGKKKSKPNLVPIQLLERATQRPNSYVVSCNHCKPVLTRDGVRIV